MVQRVSTDPEGTQWRVWNCTSANIPGPLGGWLCFEFAIVKRRLCPVPHDWESCPPKRLYLLSRVATPLDYARATSPENVAFILQTLRTGPTDYDRISVAPRIATVHFPGSPRSSREEYLLDWNATLQGVLCTPPLGIVFALLLTGCARGLRIAHNPMQMARVGGPI